VEGSLSLLCQTGFATVPLMQEPLLFTTEFDFFFCNKRLFNKVFYSIFSKKKFVAG
jgi:hypothetical protein